MYYNENDPYCIAWLQRLMDVGAIPHGRLDHRDIHAVDPEDVRGDETAHWFSGIGGWAYALQLAGWDTARPVWTASVPCQPWSTAGKHRGADDDRHLWPVLFRLICERHPQCIIGENVTGAIRLGWLDGIFADLEGEGYTCGAAVLGAHSVGAPHIRQRVYWVATQRVVDTKMPQRWGAGSTPDARRGVAEVGGPSTLDVVGHALSNGAQRSREGEYTPISAGEIDRLAHADGQRPLGEHALLWPSEPGRDTPALSQTAWGGTVSRMGDSRRSRLAGRQSERRDDDAQCSSAERAGNAVDFWDAYDFVYCRDGKRRHIPQPESVFLVVSDGLSSVLGPVWCACVAQIKEKAVKYAAQAKTDTGEALRALWGATFQKALRQKFRGYDCVPEEALLLLALCQSAWDLGPELRGPASDFSEMSAGVLRILRGDSRGLASAARPPHQRGLEGSSPRPEDALHSLSFATAQPQTVQTMLALRPDGSLAEDVRETLSAVEEVWRSALEQAAKCGDIKLFHDYASALIAADAYPLAHGVPGRAHLLKGAGNAIVPQVAALFIRAFLAAEVDGSTYAS